MAKPKVDPIAWAKSEKRETGGRKCFTCHNKDVSDVIKLWVPLWKAGKITISVRQAHDFLAKNYGYAYTTSALNRCLVEHHGATFRG
jgi:hypothetical protein